MVPIAMNFASENISYILYQGPQSVSDIGVGSVVGVGARSEIFEIDMSYVTCVCGVKAKIFFFLHLWHNDQNTKKMLEVFFCRAHADENQLYFFMWPNNVPPS